MKRLHHELASVGAYSQVAFEYSTESPATTLDSLGDSKEVGQESDYRTPDYLTLPEGVVQVSLGTVTVERQLIPSPDAACAAEDDEGSSVDRENRSIHPEKRSSDGNCAQDEAVNESRFFFPQL